MRTITKKPVVLNAVCYRLPPELIKGIVKAAKKDGVAINAKAIELLSAGLATQ